jgi:hypothetical protein
MILKLIKRGDLIVDPYGNFYYVTDINQSNVRVVNAFMDLCFRRALDDIYYEQYKGQLVGERPLALLKGNLDMILNKKSKFSLIPLEELQAEYEVFIDPLIDVTSLKEKG